MTIVDRYTAREFMGPFAAAVAGFTVMLLSGLLFELTDLIVDRKIPVDTVLQLLLFRLPSVVVVSLPIAVLFGALLALGRLAKDSELTILLGTGTPFRRLAAPILVFAAAVSGVSYVLNEQIVPASNHRAETLFREAIFRDPLPTVQEGVFFRGAEDRFFYVEEVDRRTKAMRRILVYELAGDPYPRMISADRGAYEDRVWRLYDGVIKRLDEKGFTVEDFGFESMEYPIDRNLDVFLGNQKTTDEMTRKELAEHINLFKRSGLDVDRFEIAYHMKAALPFAGLLWAMVGTPLSLRAIRGGRVFGIVVSLAVAFLYYVLSSLFRSLGGNGVIDPLAAAWITNVIYAAVGSCLMLKADR